MLQNNASEADLEIFTHRKSLSQAGGLASVFEPGQFRRAAELALDKLEEYLADSSIRGLALTDPAVLLKEARRWTNDSQGEIQPLDDEKLSEILDLYIKTGIQVYSRGYMGRQFSGVAPLAAVVDLVSSVVSQPSSFYEAAQLPNVVERLMQEEFGRLVGWNPDHFAMVTTSGGSLANLTALLAARNARFPVFWKEGAAVLAGRRPAVAVGEDAHYSVRRAVGILGVGEDQIVRLPLDGKLRICPQRARACLDEAEDRGLEVFCMVASAGTTATGAIDPLGDLAELAHDRNIWFHVDGSHGASLLVSDDLRPRLAGIEKADSFVLDAHKMLFVPAMCTLLFYREKEKSYGAFRQEASYVFERKPDIYTAYDSAEQNFECTKRPMIMNLWVPWALHGRAFFAKKVETLCQLAAAAHAVLKGEPDFEPLHEPEANILCFRYHPHSTEAPPGLQLEIRNRIKSGGKFFISKVDMVGDAALRVVFMNHEIGVEHFGMLLCEIRRIGRELTETRACNCQP